MAYKARGRLHNGPRFGSGVRDDQQLSNPRFGLRFAANLERPGGNPVDLGDGDRWRVRAGRERRVALRQHDFPVSRRCRCQPVGTDLRANRGRAGRPLGIVLLLSAGLQLPHHRPARIHQSDSVQLRRRGDQPSRDAPTQPGGDLARQREIDMRDLYEFSRRLAVAFDVSDIHAAIEDHLAVRLAAQARALLPARAMPRRSPDATPASPCRSGSVTEVAALVAGEQARPAARCCTIRMATPGWCARCRPRHRNSASSPSISATHRASDADELRARVDAVLADATATLERLGVAHAINEARMRSQTDQLREALIGSVSHELRTPLASIMGAATVLGAAPALDGQTRSSSSWSTTCATKPSGSTTTSRICSTPAAFQQRRHQSAHRMGRPRRHHQFGDRALPPPHRRPPRRARCAARPAADPRRSGAGAAGADPDFRQCREIFARRLGRSPSPRAPRDGRLAISVSDEGSGLTDAGEAEDVGPLRRAATATPRPPAARASGFGLPAPSSPPMAASIERRQRRAGPRHVTLAIELPGDASRRHSNGKRSR